MRQTNFPKRKEARREEAMARQAAYAELSPKQKLAALDAKFGKGLGAARERARIEASMKKAEAKAEAETKADEKKAEAKAAKKKRGKKEEQVAS